MTPPTNLSWFTARIEPVSTGDIKMKKMLLKLILVPVWFLTRLLKPLLPQSHPWKHYPLTLQFWYDKGTLLATAA